MFDLGVIATNKTMQEDIKKEATAMKNLKHDNIVKLIGRPFLLVLKAIIIHLAVNNYRCDKKSYQSLRSTTIE